MNWLKLLLKEKAQINLQKDDKGLNFSLKIASQYGNHEIVEELLSQNADVDLQNNKGWSSLMSASKNGHEKVVNLLVGKDANINLQNDRGWTALMYASEEGHSKVAKQLMDHGANMNFQIVLCPWL